MKELTVNHYLTLYKSRIEAAKQGISKPEKYVIKQMENLVSHLEKLDKNKEVRLCTKANEASFICDNEIIGTIKNETKEKF